MATGPFITKTEGWLNLALKRVLTLAVEGGYDAVAFASGEQNAEHYNLSRQVDSIRWGGLDNGNKVVEIVPSQGALAMLSVAPDGRINAVGSSSLGEQLDNKMLDEAIGKELAERILSEDKGELKGGGLTVGGEGMRAFYDKIVPNTVNALLKKVGGGRVGAMTLGQSWEQFLAGRGLKQVGDKLLTMSGGFQINTAPVFDAYKAQNPEGFLTQPGFVITDKMRESVQAGQPLFSRREGQEKASEIELAIAKAYGKALDKLQAKGLVTLTQTREQALEAAARARSAATGEPMAQVRAGLMEQVRRALRLWGGARTVNDALVPETPEYAGSRTGDLASIPAGTKLPAGPIRVAVGQAFGPHRGFGAEHLADNARRDAGRMPPQQTGDLAEDLMRQTVAVLRGVRQAHEHEGKFILVNPVAQQAIVMTHRDAQGSALSAHPAATTGYYSVTSVRPYKGDPKALWGNPEWVGRLTFPTRDAAATPPSNTDTQAVALRQGRTGQEVQSERFDFNGAGNEAQGSVSPK